MSTRSFVHLVAHALPGQQPFAEPEHAWWMWHTLRRAWPTAAASCLMPDHLHVLVPGRLRAARRRLGGIVSGFTRHVGQRRIWATLPPATPIRDAKHLARQIRYVHLNPCRSKLVADPLRWPWSTHRGVIGAEVDPWVMADTLAQELGWSRDDFAQRFHAYVSGDPSVDVAGTPFPVAAQPQSWPSVPLDRVALAALSATPWSPGAQRRRTIVALAASQGWGDARFVARALGVSVQATRRMMAQAVAEPIGPALLCLGDDRLCLAAVEVKRRGNASPKAPPPWRSRLTPRSS